MGEKSDSKKVASPYVVLENRPLDQWKVTELKEELKKRKLATKGLKEELVKRLDEAVRAEMDDAKQNLEDDFNSEAEPVAHSDDAENTTDVTDHSESKKEKLDESNTVDELGNKNVEKTDVELEVNTGHTDDSLQQSFAENRAAEDEVSVVYTQVETVEVVQEVTVETTVTATEESGDGSSQLARNSELKSGPQSPEQSPEQERGEPEPDSSDLINGKQVDEVSKTQSDSMSIDTIPITEKNELKDNVIADDVKLEIDEVSKIQSSTDMILDDSKSESVEVAEEKDVKNDESKDFSNEKDKLVTTDVKQGLDVKFDDEKKDVNNVENIDITKKNDYGDAGSLEKLNLDRSSGDDSMEEDALESKQTDSKFSSDEVDNRSGKIEMKEGNSVKDMVEDATADNDLMAIEDKSFPSTTSIKRKIHDQEKAVENNEAVKRQRRWNSENLKVSEQQTANRSASTTPKDAFQNPAKHTFSRSESTKSQDAPKERVVPPSSKTPTTSLRIDNFLRPFTLKAVQEFLGKTGTVVSFWMDQIKTHCYVTYASVEEAIETRNAVCNLQWPVNGGRLLMADFVDPDEVKKRVEPPPPSPATPATTTMQPPQPSPRLKQQLPPPPSLPPPPPLADPPPAKYRAPPPPPPPLEKIDPPIVTLDDLFKKTRATPRIYYLPLSDEQVAAKMSAQVKRVN